MPLLQQHPDGRVHIKNNNQTYGDGLANFAQDYASPLPALPQGEIVRFYDKEVIHYTSDGYTQKAAPEGRSWAQGDAIIAALPTLLEKQQAREEAQQAAREESQSQEQGQEQGQGHGGRA